MKCLLPVAEMKPVSSGTLYSDYVFRASALSLNSLLLYVRTGWSLVGDHLEIGFNSSKNSTALLLLLLV